MNLKKQTVTIYHNPRCSKSRQTLDLVNQACNDANVIEYLNSPPTVAQLKELLTLLQLTPQQLMRTGEGVYKELNLSDPALSDEDLIKAMTEHPILIQRPIVVVNNTTALIGRPPEAVMDILP